MFFFLTPSNLADATHLLQGSNIGHDRPVLPPSPNYFEAIPIMSFNSVGFPHSLTTRPLSSPEKPHGIPSPPSRLPSTQLHVLDMQSEY